MEGQVSTPDGLKLHWRRWPAEGPSSGCVQIVHGLGEHSGRYDHVAASLNGSGWDVLAHDLRGHGLSEGRRGVIVDGPAMLADVARVMDAGRNPSGLHVMLGHSMGGLIAARFVAERLSASPAAWSREVDGLVLSSPALDLGMNAGQKLLLALLGRVAPDLAVGNGLKPTWISRDPAVVQAYRDDPLVHDRVTPRLVRFLLAGGEVVRQRAAHWKVPTLLLWAGADRCVAPAGSAALAVAAPPTVLSAKVFPGLFHEIFNEPEKAEVLARLSAWLIALQALNSSSPFTRRSGT
jgi:alpha-beta hydrolase superfamily lysophospholipase